MFTYILCLINIVMFMFNDGVELDIYKTNFAA